MIVFLHWLGWAVWLGAGITFMMWGPAARRCDLAGWAYTWDVLARLQRAVVAPACAVATLTGFVLSMQYAQRGYPMGALWLVLMQLMGILAAILTLAVATPLANRMAFLAARSLETGQRDPRAEPARRWLALASSISGLLIVATVYVAAAKPQ